MNYAKKTLLLLSIVLIGVNISAQTADKVIDNYLKAIGGKDEIAKIKSLYYESTVEVMGMSGNMKTTILNGKGYKQDFEIMGNPSVSCFSEKEGWSINPAKGKDVVPMTEKEFNGGKDQIFIGSPFIFYKENGYKAEITGNETVNGINTVVLKLTSPTDISSVYYFNQETSLIVKTIQTNEMGESTSTYSDYRDVNGYKLPFKIDSEMGGGSIKMKMTVKNAVLNIDVDQAIFNKP